MGQGIVYYWNDYWVFKLASLTSQLIKKTKKVKYVTMV